MSHSFSNSSIPQFSSSLRNRIALITGASRGIGEAAAVRLARAGAHVVLVARDVRGLEETDDRVRSAGGAATLAPLDLADAAKIEALAQEIAGRWGRLDILVGNAGTLGELTPAAHLDPEIWDKVMAVNVSANFHLIRCFDPLLKRSDAPRAMFVTSGVTEADFPYFGAYAASKAALEKLVVTYAAENAKTLLRANLVDPGVVATRMRAAAMPGEDPAALPAPDDISDIFVRLADPGLKDTGKKFHAEAARPAARRAG